MFKNSGWLTHSRQEKLDVLTVATLVLLTMVFAFSVCVNV